MDFDATVVEDQFPDVGPPVPGAVYWLRRFSKEGARIILNTMRSVDQDTGDVLTPAVSFFKKHGIHLYGVNENPEQKEWTTSPKVHADVYIDDKNFGMPMIDGIKDPDKEVVDWDKVGPKVMLMIQDKHKEQ